MNRTHEEVSLEKILSWKAKFYRLLIGYCNGSTDSNLDETGEDREALEDRKLKRDRLLNRVSERRRASHE